MRRLLVLFGVVTGCGRIAFELPDPVGTDAALPSYAEAVLEDKPLGYWRLGDGTNEAVDASGNRIHGLYGGVVTRGVAGALVGDPDTAAQFDGASGVVSVGTGFDFAGVVPFSVEVWIKPTLVDLSSRHVFTKQFREDPKQGYALLVRRPEGLVFERFVDGESVLESFPVAFGDEFVHVVATYDGGAIGLHINGTQVMRAADSRPMPSNTEPALIGATDNPCNFEGVIDEVAVYPTALSIEQVRAHFASGRRDVR